jgi:hypothetical protein
MDAVFLDFETTGDNPFEYQPHEFAAVPVIAGVIRKDLMWHCYFDFKKWKIQGEIFDMVVAALKARKPEVPLISPGQFGSIFRNKLKSWVDTPATLGGKNIGSFDWQFILQLEPNFRREKELIRYSMLEIGSLFVEPEDHKILSLKDCRERAMAEGAPITAENTHTAVDDALLCAELYSWEVYSHIWYGKPHPTTPNTVKIYQETKCG